MERGREELGEENWQVHRCPQGPWTPGVSPMKIVYVSKESP
jgi:hypothetical protein